MVSISFGSFPEVSGFCLEHVLHLVCAYFCEVGGTATSFLGVKKRSRGRMSGIDCGAGAGVWTGDPRALQRALQQDSWGFFCKGHTGKTAGATGGLGRKSPSDTYRGHPAKSSGVSREALPRVTLVTGPGAWILPLSASRWRRVNRGTLPPLRPKRVPAGPLLHGRESDP